VNMPGCSTIARRTCRRPRRTTASRRLDTVLLGVRTTGFGCYAIVRAAKRSSGTAPRASSVTFGDEFLFPVTRRT
jgi:hypothetical protein